MVDRALHEYGLTIDDIFRITRDNASNVSGAFKKDKISKSLKINKNFQKSFILGSRHILEYKFQNNFIAIRRILHPEEYEPEEDEDEDTDLESINSDDPMSQEMHSENEDIAGMSESGGSARVTDPVQLLEPSDLDSAEYETFDATLR